MLPLGRILSECGISKGCIVSALPKPAPVEASEGPFVDDEPETAEPEQDEERKELELQNSDDNPLEATDDTVPVEASSEIPPSGVELVPRKGLGDQRKTSAGQSKDALGRSPQRIERDAGLNYCKYFGVVSDVCAAARIARTKIGEWRLPHPG